MAMHHIQFGLGGGTAPRFATPESMADDACEQIVASAWIAQ